MNPLVSVIVPMYNAAPWIGEALESIVEEFVNTEYSDTGLETSEDDY